MTKVPAYHRLFCLLVLTLGFEASGSMLGHPHVYRSPGVMGMGGADVAVGGGPGALFSNPAGLVSMREGWHWSPLTLSVGSTRRTYDFARDLEASLGIDDDDELRESLFDLIDDYRGRNLHGQAAVLPALSWRGPYRGRPVAFSVAWLRSLSFNARPHQGFGGDGVITVDARTLEGIKLGAAMRDGPWHLGVAATTLRQHRLAQRYSARELVEIASDDDRDFSEDFTNELAQSLDLGVQYDIRVDSRYLRQARLGLAVRDLGGLDFGAGGKIPRTVNLGLAIYPPAPGLASLVISAEYTDLFNRIPTDSDPLKRTRLGIRLQAREQNRIELSYSFGFYQGAPTAGVALGLPLARLSLATYAEEQGAYAGQDRERRYVLGLGFEL